MDSPTGPPGGLSGPIIASWSPGPRSRTGSRPPGKKTLARIETDSLARALENFSGSIALEELYEGPFGVLSRVDHRTFSRLTDRVLEKNPTQDDIRLFLRDFQAPRDARHLKVLGLTTEGANLDPVPLAEILPGVPHQVWEFPVLTEITQAVRHTLAQVRTDLKARIPKRPRGRPTKAQAKQVRRAQRQEPRVSDLVEHRHLFVRKKLTVTAKKTLQRITRGLPPLRVLRAIMDEVSGLFDRRCRTARAWERLAKLRSRVRRFQQVGPALEKLDTPNLEKALPFRDDKLLPATSKAVERGDRRYRKAQRSISSVRTAPPIRQRIALDLHREQQAAGRSRTTQTLHQARAGP